MNWKKQHDVVKTVNLKIANDIACCIIIYILIHHQNMYIKYQNNVLFS